MRRASMRRGSAVLLTILPLLSPAYGLPTYFGNEAAAVTHSNVERAAVPEPAAGLPLSDTASEGPVAWLPKRKRQFGTAGPASVESSDTITMATGGTNSGPISPGVLGPAHIPNIGSEGSDHWLLPPVLKREAKAEAEAEAEAAITMATGHVPQALSATDLDLGPAPAIPAAI
ncbi:MAG: hypothetical protein LQ345_005174 [Seirophora villosa]|nr:MAG: hypothetical protein LQ345_005174 [Seirophora villosa]